MKNLGIINRCNEKCVFCRTQKFLELGTLTESSMEELKERIAQGIRQGEDLLFSGGGEPTQLADLPGLITYAKDLGAKHTVVETNAVRLADVSYVHALERSGLDECIVSLHSCYQDISEKITGSSGTFELTIQGMKNLSGSKISFEVVAHVLCSLNFNDISFFIQFIAKEFPKVRKINIGIMRPSLEMPQTMELTPKYTEVVPRLKEAFDHSLSLGVGIELDPLSVPLCVAKGYEEMLSYLRMAREGKFQEIEDQRVRWDMTFPGICESCSAKPACMGLRREYLKKYGMDELQPYQEDLSSIMEKIHARIKKDPSRARFWPQ